MVDLTLCQRIIKNIQRVIIGKDEAIRLLMTSLLADGHALLEDVPGLGKTLIAKFFVIATQNPIEQEGTFLLPEAQLDRFLLRIHMGYPSREEEIEIMARFQKDEPLEKPAAVDAPSEIVAMQKARREIKVSVAIRNYIADIVRATREEPTILFGSSPRGALGLQRAGQAYAALQAREYVLPDDIKALCRPVLNHRLILREEERFRGVTVDQILDGIIARIPVPVGNEH